MTGPHALTTTRLRLRRWKDGDRRPFAEMNQDPAVMEYFPALVAPADSTAMIDRIEASFEERSLGLWATEEAATGRFAGFIGLAVPNFEAPFTPAVEVGWRLARWAWGRGYATEGARAAIDDGFDRLDLDEIVSFTSVGNHRSRRVMEKLGMRHDRERDFLHPNLDPDDELAPHVLYLLGAADRAWEPGTSTTPASAPDPQV